MRVRMLRTHRVAHDPTGNVVTTFPEGTEHDVSDEMAEGWLKDGLCQIVMESHPAACRAKKVVIPEEFKPSKPTKRK